MKDISLHRSRRYLPSISLLTAFESVLRTGTTAAAARELDLTQGAVSRLVQNLETQLGQPLFLRERRRLIPTTAAHTYGRDVTRALDLISRATMEFVANPGGGVLSLAILPAFGTWWLTPRLPDFLTANPGVTINLATRLQRFNFLADGFDAAIHFGTDDWRGADHLHLFNESLIACAAPVFLARHPMTHAADMLKMPLLQMETRPTAWADWFGAHNLAAPLARGMLFDQFAPMVQAAVHGLGIALLPEFLARPELAAGRLKSLPGPTVDGVGSYWLVWPQARADYPPLVALRDWLAREVAGPSSPSSE